MVIIRILFVLLVWLIILSSCSNIPSDSVIVDTRGIKHFYTSKHDMENGSYLRYCAIHEEWEKVEPLNGVIQ